MSVKRSVCRVDPLQHPLWDDFVENHSKASVFHTSSWLRALHQTYGYKSLAYTISETTDRIDAAMLFGLVESWFSASRLISLPFSDHCELLVNATEDKKTLVAGVEQDSGKERWKYLELRPLEPVELNTKLLQSRIEYSFHRLALTPTLDRLFANLHKSSIQRKIRRAERESLQYSAGCSEQLLEDFYRLFLMTRKRLGVPPQPRKWFVNLVACFGSKLKIRVAYKGSQPVAALMALEHKDVLYYKYSASHPKFTNMGGIHFLLWRAIQEAKGAGLRFVDFGRTDSGQEGLNTFKRRWGAVQSQFTYIRLSKSATPTHLLDLSTCGWKSMIRKQLVSMLPTSILSLAGQLLYKHAA